MTGPLALAQSELLMLARRDPRLAVAVYDRPGRFPQAYRLRARFEDQSPDEPQLMIMDEAIGEDLFVVDVRYQIRRPDYAAGSIWKAQSDVNNAINSGVSVLVNVVAGLGCPFVMNTTYAPIETVFTPPLQNDGYGSWPEGWVMHWNQTMKVWITMDRAMTADEVPTDIFVLIKGMRLGCCGFGGLTIAGACERLSSIFKREGWGALPEDVRQLVE